MGSLCGAAVLAEEVEANGTPAVGFLGNCWGVVGVVSDAATSLLVWLSNILSRATPHFLSVCKGTLHEAND